MTELEKKQKIDLLILEFKKEADKLEASDNTKFPHTILDNGHTEYTELYNKYKKKIDKIKNS